MSEPGSGETTARGVAVRPVVWLLEDSRLQAETALRALRASCTVTHFQDSLQLLEALQGAQPDVLVLDWEVPEISGLEVLKVVRELHDEAALPVLMLTVRRGPEELAEALDARANDFASKPFSAVELRARVATLGRVSLLHKRSQQVERALQQALLSEERAHSAAQQQRQELHQSFMQAPVAVALLSGPSHVCEYVNTSLQALLGGRDVLGRPLMEAMPELVGTSVPLLLRRVFVAGVSFSANELGLQLDPGRAGVSGFYDIALAARRNQQQEIDGILVVIADVTERVHARQQAEVANQLLSAREAELRAVTDALPVLVSHVSADERYALVNSAYEDWFGIQREQLLGRTLLDVIGPAAYAVLSPFVKRGLAGERLSFEQHGVPYRLGGTRDVRVEFVPRKTLAGEPNGYVALLHDITQQTRLAQQHEQAARREAELRQRAEQASRAKDEFIAMLGHELRNPLAPILTVLELLSMKQEPQLQAERALIERQARHMARLVEDLLDVSRIASGKVELRKERVELVEIINRALETAAPLMEHHRHRTTINVPTGLLVEADVARLTQVFSNLFTNAAKYTEPEGQVHVEATRGAERVVVDIVDSGRGIAPDMLPRLFELFSQEQQNLDRAQGGLGLGLAIVKSLTELHGGHVSAHSAGPGAGSTFRVDLPLSARHTPTHTQLTPAIALDVKAARLRVLVVDDNEDAAYLLVEALRHRGCEVRSAGDATSALTLVDQDPPQVAILDIGLPGIDGYQLARLMRSRLGSGVRLVALTGYGQADDRARAQAAGFDLHLVKPVSLHDLYTALIERK